jgi:hypothetical protein
VKAQKIFLFLIGNFIITKNKIKNIRIDNEETALVPAKNKIASITTL